jgi:hypothetical protein
MESPKQDLEPPAEAATTPDEADVTAQAQSAEDVGRRAQELIEELHDRDPQKTTVIRGKDRIGGT